MHNFPHYIQLDAMDCGPTCLRMIAKFYGKSYSLQTLRSRSFITREGVSMLGISDAAESIGFRTSGLRITFKQLVEDVPLPCILHWSQKHFVVCYDIRKKKDGYRIAIADPANQLVTYKNAGSRLKLMEKRKEPPWHWNPVPIFINRMTKNILRNIISPFSLNI